MKTCRQLSTERFQAADSNPSRKWSVTRDLLHLTQVPETLTPVYSKLLCDTLADFFISKIQTYLQTFFHIYQLWADTLMLCMLMRNIPESSAVL